MLFLVNEMPTKLVEELQPQRSRAEQPHSGSASILSLSEDYPMTKHAKIHFPPFHSDGKLHDLMLQDWLIMVCLNCLWRLTRLGSVGFVCGDVMVEPRWLTRLSIYTSYKTMINLLCKEGKLKPCVVTYILLQWDGWRSSRLARQWRAKALNPTHIHHDQSITSGMFGEGRLKEGTDSVAKATRTWLLDIWMRWWWTRVLDQLFPLSTHSIRAYSLNEKCAELIIW